jgi:hypothetical protein
VADIKIGSHDSPRLQGSHTGGHYKEVEVPEASLFSPQKKLLVSCVHEFEVLGRRRPAAPHARTDARAHAFCFAFTPPRPVTCAVGRSVPLDEKISDRRYVPGKRGLRDPRNAGIESMTLPSHRDGSGTRVRSGNSVLINGEEQVCPFHRPPPWHVVDMRECVLGLRAGHSPSRNMASM